MFYIYAENKLRYRHTSVKVHYTFVFFPQKSGSSHLYSHRCSSYVHKNFWRTEKFKSTRYKFLVFLHIHIGLFHTRKTFRCTYAYIMYFLKLLVLWNLCHKQRWTISNTLYASKDNEKNKPKLCFRERARTFCFN